MISAIPQRSVTTPGVPQARVVKFPRDTPEGFNQQVDALYLMYPPQEQDDFVVRLQSVLLPEASLRGQVLVFGKVDAVGHDFYFLLTDTVADKLRALER